MSDLKGTATLQGKPMLEAPDIAGELPAAGESTADETSLKESANEAMHKVEARAGELKDSAVETLHAIEERAGEMRESAQEINHRAVEFIQHNPVITIAGAFGVGYLIGSLAARRWII